MKVMSYLLHKWSGWAGGPPLMTLEVTVAHRRCARVSSMEGERILSSSPMSAVQIRKRAALA